MQPKLDNMSDMTRGLLRHGLIALLILSLAGLWQAAPSFAAQPCDMTSSATCGHPLPANGPCKSAGDHCLASTICCQVSPSLMTPYTPAVTPIRWKPVSYQDVIRPLVGRHLQPDLHPPTIRL